jgi:hypothetical protein
MEHHIKKDGRFVYSKQGLEEDEVTGTTDGQKFGQSLYNTKKNGLCNSYLSSPYPNSKSQITNPK